MSSIERDYFEALKHDKEVATRRTGCDAASDYYAKVKDQPKDEQGRLLDYAKILMHLEALDMAQCMYTTDEDEIFINEWNVGSSELLHRHKELGRFQMLGSYEDHESGDIQWDAADGVCSLCKTTIPGDIYMIHRFYQL